MSSEQKRTFEDKGYLHLQNMVPDEILRIYFEYAKSYARTPGYFEVELSTRSLGRYADAVGEVLLLRLMPVVEDRVGRKLLPTYSYLRFYTPDSCLEKHTDRPSCEYSVTLTVGREGSQDSWPMLLECQGRTERVELAVGDGLIFQGAKLPHWREPMVSGSWLQLFMHYVDAGGAHSGQRFDGRRHVGPWMRRVS